MEWKKWVPLATGVGMLIALIIWAGAEGVWRILQMVNPIYLSLAVLMYVFGTLAWGLRWHVLMRGLGIDIKFRHTLVALLIGIFVNNMTPGARGGGEPVRMYYVSKKAEHGYGPVFATVMGDRILDFIPIAVMMVISMVCVYDMGQRALTLILLIINIGIFAGVAFGTAVMLNDVWMQKILVWLFKAVSRILPSRMQKYEERFLRGVEEQVPQFSRGMKLLLRDKKTFALALFFSFLSWTFVILRVYFIFLSMGMSISAVAVMVVQMVGTAVGLISIIPGGAGLTAATMSGVYMLFGIHKSLAVTASIVDRLISFWIPTFIGSALTFRFSSGAGKKADG
ncbi:MAG: flippase-like domain-containing protein [Thermococci archaeon]|nr:flippase-like domain-containing protein [Thermococci archaeon]